MNPQIVLLIIFITTTFVQQSLGENASCAIWFEVTDEGLSCPWGFVNGGAPAGMVPLVMMMVYCYVLHPQPMIQFPLVVKNRWSGKVYDRGVANWIGETKLESRSQVVTVPAGTFKNCLKLTTKIRHAAGGPPTDFMSGTRYMWFAPGLGLIKFEYHHGNEKLTHILLKEYVIGEGVGKRDYFPLNKGMEWKYDWHNGYYDVILEEECYATGEREKLPEWLGRQECLPIFCTNELSGRTAKGWAPKFPIFEGVNSKGKISMTWGYIKRTF